MYKHHGTIPFPTLWGSPAHRSDSARQLLLVLAGRLFSLLALAITLSAIFAFSWGILALVASIGWAAFIGIIGLIVLSTLLSVIVNQRARNRLLRDKLLQAISRTRGPVGPRGAMGVRGERGDTGPPGPSGLGAFLGALALFWPSGENLHFDYDAALRRPFEEGAGLAATDIGEFAAVLRAHSLLYTTVGEPNRGLAAIELLISRLSNAQPRGGAILTAIALQERGRILLDTGEPIRALDALSTGIAVFETEAHQSPATIRILARMHAERGRISVVLAQPEPAIDDFRRAVALLDRAWASDTSAREEMAIYLLNLASLLAGRGERKEADAYLSRAALIFSQQDN